MSTWTEAELREFDQIREIRVAGRREDGSQRTLVIIWCVVVDGTLYVRSVHGPNGVWYQGVIRYHQGTVAWNEGTRDAAYIPDGSADDSIDAAYFRKYGNGESSRLITRPTARSTTLRVEPR